SPEISATPSECRTCLESNRRPTSSTFSPSSSTGNLETMPIRIPNDLPARETLQSEGVMVMTEATARRQDIRPLHIGLLNLMPNKIKTETQFARLIGATPLQVELTLVKMTSHTPKNTSAEHMIAFYSDWE